ncbi:hypothetical protein SEA_FORZA_196 [Gordonia phage Forza]|uniref:Uncharacterized protein n=1 Tax=Gordonia phage Forza TaxID=2571247 RepID=A0A650EYB5_9CAUD|nr:hypothetical protein PP303_gp003 [Gordonia phage Forza]YP_010649044.1 hypothetical protein PP303_gp132 [Gordonia phage Forza]QEM41472.1 hypothetical protein SEA_BOOPY_3 [Gordonia phage Boopy]UXE04146.1 hypothetical protein SEA_BLUENGOLD_2 [Gordonia phage BlueNGold]WBF03785.1 hypothetical protein SEA_MAREELIH_2 [Gordonia phage Mareelih]QEM41632.1 hypothetical protein SEA_BOOPY_196 [Gordonia phage Boopy]QGT54996.1 hypothetical protein SEA_FORZA_3 [Gordonia phage Forza]
MKHWSKKTYTPEQARKKALELSTVSLSQAMHGGKCPSLMQCTYCPIKYETASDGKTDRFTLVIKVADSPDAVSRLANHIYERHLHII